MNFPFEKDYLVLASLNCQLSLFEELHCIEIVNVHLLLHLLDGPMLYEVFAAESEDMKGFHEEYLGLDELLGLKSLDLGVALR